MHVARWNRTDGMSGGRSGNAMEGGAVVNLLFQDSLKSAVFLRAEHHLATGCLRTQTREREDAVVEKSF